jgi:hypothetical protein
MIRQDFNAMLLIAWLSSAMNTIQIKHRPEFSTDEAAA